MTLQGLLLLHWLILYGCWRRACSSKMQTSRTTIKGLLVVLWSSQLLSLGRSLLSVMSWTSLQRPYLSYLPLSDGLRTVWREEGIRGLYKVCRFRWLLSWCYANQPCWFSCPQKDVRGDNFIENLGPNTRMGWCFARRCPVHGVRRIEKAWIWPWKGPSRRRSCTSATNWCI